MLMAKDISVSMVLSSSIAPVALITAVAFLTNIMAPRFGRCVDRIRSILQTMKTLSPESPEYKNKVEQLHVLYERTRVLKNTMTIAGVCILFVILTITSTFSNLLYGFPSPELTIVAFLSSLGWLVLLMIGIIYDFLCSLRAVRLEIDFGLKTLK